MSAMELQAGVLKALGLEGQKVTSLIIAFEVNKTPTVNVTRIVGMNNHDLDVIEALSQYVLVPRDEFEESGEAGRPA